MSIIYHLFWTYVVLLSSSKDRHLIQSVPNSRNDRYRQYPHCYNKVLCVTTEMCLSVFNISSWEILSLQYYHLNENTENLQQKFGELWTRRTCTWFLMLSYHWRQQHFWEETCSIITVLYETVLAHSLITDELAAVFSQLIIHQFISWTSFWIRWLFQLAEPTGKQLCCCPHNSLQAVAAVFSHVTQAENKGRHLASTKCEQ